MSPPEEASLIGTVAALNASFEAFVKHREESMGLFMSMNQKSHEEITETLKAHGKRLDCIEKALAAHKGYAAGVWTGTKLTAIAVWSLITVGVGGLIAWLWKG